MITHIAIFVLALAALVKGADYFVEYSARLARQLGVSDFIIGLTITSIGTSVPELAASVSAALQDHTGIIIGNVVGSNISNIGLVLGLTAALRAFETEKKMYERDGYIMIAAVILFFAFALDNKIESFEALIFMLGYVFYILFLIRSDNQEKSYQFRDFMKYVFDFEYLPPIRSRMFRKKEQGGVIENSNAGGEKLIRQRKFWINISVTILACLAIMVGARFLIDEAAWIAGLLSVPESVIGLSLIAVGTSLPELTVSISAAKKGKGSLVLGNLIGSNIANILLILGVTGSIQPLRINEISVVYTIPIMLFFSLTLVYFIRSDWKITRTQGWIAVVSYIIFMVLAFTLEWS